MSNVSRVTSHAMPQWCLDEEVVFVMTSNYPGVFCLIVQSTHHDRSNLQLKVTFFYFYTNTILCIISFDLTLKILQNICFLWNNINDCIYSSRVLLSREDNYARNNRIILIKLFFCLLYQSGGSNIAVNSTSFILRNQLNRSRCTTTNIQ